MQDKYVINKNELLSLLRYEILYKWKESIKIKPENKKFSNYLLNETSLGPEHPFIQSFCSNEEEHNDPITTGVYEHILPADLARYHLKFYSVVKNYEIMA